MRKFKILILTLLRNKDNLLLKNLIKTDLSCYRSPLLNVKMIKTSIAERYPRLHTTNRSIQNYI